MKRSKRRKQCLRAAFCILLLGIVCYVYQSSVIPAFLEVRKVTAGSLTEVLLLSSVYFLSEGMITFLMVRQTEHPFTYWQALKTYFYACFYRAVSFGSGGGISEIYYMAKHKVEAGRATGISLLKYAFHRVCVLTFCGVLIVMNSEFCRSALLYSSEYVIGGFIYLALLALFLFILCRSSQVCRLCLFLLDWLAKHFSRLNEQTEQLKIQLLAFQEEAGRILARPQTVVTIVAVNLLKFTALYSVPYLMIRQDSLAYANGLAITALSVTLGGVFPVPAGMGAIEFVFTTLFASVITQPKALAAVVVYRFVYFILPFVIGGLGIVAQKGYQNVLIRKEK